MLPGMAFLLFFATATNLWAVPLKQLMEAHQAYENQQFEKAVEGYESLKSEFPENGHLFYNLGNTHYRLGNLGKAIAYYVRAQQLLPRNEDVAANLQYLRQQTQDQQESLHQTPLHRWSHQATKSEWLLVLLGTSLVFWGLLTMVIYRRYEVLLWGVGVSGMLSVIAITGLVLHATHPMPDHVVIADKALIRAAPNSEATMLFVLHEGAEVLLTSEKDHWAQVQFGDKKGWMPTQDLFRPVRIAISR